MPDSERKARAPERDYSHRLLIDKLGVKTGQRVAALGVESAKFARDLTSRVPGYSPGKRAADGDLIFFSAEARGDLSRLESLGRAIQKNAAIWVAYLKGQTHIRQIDVIQAGKAAGLTDNKAYSFSATHTALRFVILVAKR
jgi:hypothetical protein